jgi:hypothetical protein
MDKIKSFLSDSFQGPFESLDKIWQEKLDINHGKIAGLVFTAFATDEIYIYNDVVIGSGADSCLANKLELFRDIACKYCNFHLGRGRRFIGILRNDRKSLEKATQAIAREFK